MDWGAGSIYKKKETNCDSDDQHKILDNLMRPVIIHKDTDDTEYESI